MPSEAAVMLRKMNREWLKSFDPTFGEDPAVEGASYSSVHDVIKGSLFTSPADAENAVADSISACLDIVTMGDATEVYIKCALYLHGVSLSLVGETLPTTFTATFTKQYKTFNFATPKPTLTASTDYVLKAWAGSNYEVTVANPRIYYNAGATDQWHEKIVTYTGAPFPNPLTAPIHADRQASIYCTYTPPVVAVPAGLNIPEVLQIILS